MIRFRVLPFAVLGSALACSDPVPATARVFASAQVTAGSETGVNDSAKCGLANEQLFTIGKTDDAISSGDDQNGATVSVECTVRPDGDGFFVLAFIGLQGKGSVTFNGKMSKSGEQKGLSATFANNDIGGFKATDCIFTFAEEANSADNPPIERGRVWGRLTCPHLFRDDQDRTCQGIASVRLENCTQQ